jgi:di/tricarboxylate transporter
MIYGLVSNGSTVSPLACVTALILTACYTGMCPFSQNGALMLSTADDETKEYLFYRSILWCVVLLIISVIYALIGGYGIWG